jgi:uncharacterized protein (DUF362 family)
MGVLLTMEDEMWVRGTRSHDLEEKLHDLDRLWPAKGLSRRTFLKISGVVVAGLALPIGCSSSQPAEDVRADGVHRLTMPPVPIGAATVGIVGYGDIAAKVYRAIELAGGLNEIQSGDTVVIQPNLTTGYELAPRVTTHPEVQRAVIRAVKERTEAANITVAEASSYMDPSTLAVAQNVGVFDVVLSEGVNFLAWEDEEYIDTTCFDFENIGFRIEIPKSLTDSRFKHFINVPMLKNHDQVSRTNVDYTCCIKNHVGVLSRQKRTTGGGKGIHTKDLGERVAELNLAAPVHTMNVVDALTVILSGGPASGDMHWTEPGLILACKDRVACDSVGLAILRHYASQQGVSRPYVEKSVWEQAQIRRALQLNLGRNSNNIEIAHDGVNDINGIMAKWN